MHDTHVSFRANDRLVAALAAQARNAGCSVSEYLRAVVREKVADELIDGPEPLDPYSALKAAATGSLAAQRALADRAVEMISEEGAGYDPVMCLTEGLVFARLAAAQGDLSDQGRVISMLGAFAAHVPEEEATQQLGEAVARVAMAADQGAEVADILLPDLAQSVSANVMAVAQAIRARLADRIGAN